MEHRDDQQQWYYTKVSRFEDQDLNHIRPLYHPEKKLEDTNATLGACTVIVCSPIIEANVNMNRPMGASMVY